MHAVGKSIETWKKIQKLNILATVYQLDSLPTDEWPMGVKIALTESISEIYELENNIAQGVPPEAFFNGDTKEIINHIKNLWNKFKGLTDLPQNRLNTKAGFFISNPGELLLNSLTLTLLNLFNLPYFFYQFFPHLPDVSCPHSNYQITAGGRSN